MNYASVSLIALMSITIASQPANAGISSMINDFFTFREDQKELITPQRTLPPKHIVIPNYDKKASKNWSNYYTRDDLQAVPHMDDSSMVMRKQPRPHKYVEKEETAKDKTIGYEGIQRRDRLNKLEAYQGNVYIGNPGQKPFNLNGQGNAGKKTKISKPKYNWQGAPSKEVQPRVGDYDYVKRHASRSSSNAFTGDIPLRNEGAVEIARSSGYFKKELPVPSKNSAYYNKKLPQNYVVQPYDSLSGISGQEQIYGDWKMWPLIYDKNRTQIKDPDLIHPGQNFGIPRGTSLQNNSAARERAMEKKAPYDFYDGR